MAAINRRVVLATLGAAVLSPGLAMAQGNRMQSWPLATPRATGIHDVAPAPDGGVWFTAQRSGHLGWFDPGHRQRRARAAGRGLGAARRDPGARPGGLDHRRRAERDRARGLAVRRSGYSPCPTARRTRTSTPRLSTATATSGSPARAASSASWPPRPARSRCRTRHAAAGRTASAPRRRATSGGVRWPAPSSRASTAATGDRSSSSRRRRTRARAASGATARAASGSANGTAATSRCTTRGRRGSLADQWKLPGAEPRCYAVYVDERDIVWVATGAPTRCYASTRQASSSSASPSRAKRRTCARSSAGPARSGCPRAAPRHIYGDPHRLSAALIWLRQYALRRLPSPAVRVRLD